MKRREFVSPRGGHATTRSRAAAGETDVSGTINRMEDALYLIAETFFSPQCPLLRLHCRFKLLVRQQACPS